MEKLKFSMDQSKNNIILINKLPTVHLFRNYESIDFENKKNI